MKLLSITFKQNNQIRDCRLGQVATFRGFFTREMVGNVSRAHRPVPCYDAKAVWE